MSKVLIKLELDGNQVKQHFSVNNQVVVETITVTEFQRQAKLMKSLLKGSDVVPDPPEEEEDAPRTDMLSVISAFQQEMRSENDQKFTHMMTQHKHLRDMLESLSKQKSEVWEMIQRETSEGITTLKENMEKLSKFQQESLQSVVVKESLIRDIMVDLEKKKEWTWESARKVNEEIQRSMADLRVSKVTVDATVAEAKAHTQSVLETVSREHQKSLRKFEESLNAMKDEVSSLVSVHKKDIADQAEKLDRENIERYKDHYFQSELERRTQVEREKSYYICNTAQTASEQIQKRVDDLVESSEFIQGQWASLTGSAEQKILELTEEERVALHEFRIKLDEFHVQASRFKLLSVERSAYTQKLSSLLEYLVYQVENDSCTLFDELKQLEADKGKLEASELVKLLLEDF